MDNRVKYQKKYERIMFELKLRGVDNKTIWETIEISKNTFYRWIKEKPNFRKLYIKAVNAKTDALKALIKKAIGFRDGEEYFPPDFQSIKYLLRNISDFDKELEHNIKIDLQRLDNEKFEKWLDKNELEVYEKLRKIYEKENGNNTK